MKFPKIASLFGLFGKKSAKPVLLEKPGASAVSPQLTGTHYLLAAPAAAAVSSPVPGSSEKAAASEGTPVVPEGEPPFLMFLDEMGFYLPSATLSHHTMVFGSSAKGKSSFSAMLEANERQAVKVVTVSGPAAVLDEWSSLADSLTVESWKTWLPDLQEAGIDEENEFCVQALLKCPMTCAELYDALSSKFPDTVITITWYKPTVLTL